MWQKNPKESKIYVTLLYIAVIIIVNEFKLLCYLLSKVQKSTRPKSQVIKTNLAIECRVQTQADK